MLEAPGVRLRPVAWVELVPGEASTSEVVQVAQGIPRESVDRVETRSSVGVELVVPQPPRQARITVVGVEGLTEWEALVVLGLVVPLLCWSSFDPSPRPT